MNGPRLGCRFRPPDGCRSRCGNSYEGDLLRIGGPLRRLIAIDAWVEESQRVLGDGVDADEAMVATIAAEGETGAIWGPAKFVGTTAGVDPLCGCMRTFGTRGPDLTAAEKGEDVAVGENAGALPSAILRGSAASGATQTSCWTPAGLLRGLENSPRPLALSPRVKATALPSGFQASWLISWPSSSRKRVICFASKAGARATQMLRTPLEFSTHATASPFGDAFKSEGNGELNTC